MTGVGPFRVIALTLAALIAASAGASAAPHPPMPPHHAPPANLDRLFAAAVAAPSLRSYTVPVDFKVRVHKPIGIRADVVGTAYFKAPAQSALQITHASGLIGGFFKGAYKLDVVPQAWPYKFHVISSTSTIVDGRGVQQLTAQPRDPASTITRVIFALSLPDHQRSPAAPKQRSRYDQAHHLVGPLQDAVDAKVAHDLLDPVVVQITVAAEELKAPHPPPRTPIRCRRSWPWRKAQAHRGRPGRAPPRPATAESAPLSSAHRHLGQTELQRLIFVELAAEGAALAHIGDGPVERRLARRRASRPRC